MNNDNLKEFLLWLITPKDDNEKHLFKNLVDDYIKIKNNIDSMSRTELYDEIDRQIEYTGKVIDRDE